MLESRLVEHRVVDNWTGDEWILADYRGPPRTDVFYPTRKINISAATTSFRYSPAKIEKVERENLVHEKFRRLTSQWKRETSPFSSISRKCTHPTYQSIIGMGGSAIPLLLSELKQQPDHWFWALKAITGDDPVPTSKRGNVKAMTKAWLDWSRDHGFIL